MKLYHLRDVEGYIEQLLDKIKKLEHITYKQQREINQLKLLVNGENYSIDSFNYYNVDSLKEKILNLVLSIKSLYEEEQMVEKLIFLIKEIELYNFDQSQIIDMIKSIDEDNILKSFFEIIPLLDSYLDQYINYCYYYILYKKEDIKPKNTNKFEHVVKYMQTYLNKLNDFKLELLEISDNIIYYLS